MVSRCCGSSDDGVYPVNESVAIAARATKLRSLQLLARDGVGLPVTAFAYDSKRTDDLLSIVGGAPVVIKLLEGTQGIGVVLSETHKSAKSVIEAFHGADVAILVQEFIKEAGGPRHPRLHRGAEAARRHGAQGCEGRFPFQPAPRRTASMIELTAAEKATALKAARSMGLNVAGVDLLRSGHGPVVMEVNSSPGLEGIEKATGVDVALAIIKFVERHAKPGRTKTKGKG